MADDKKNILIVDDDKFLLDMYSIKFGEHGFNVTSCLGAVKALEQIEAGFVPEVMLLDVIMPTMDGFEFLEKVRTENLIPHTTVIMLTNLGQEKDVQRGKSLGAKGYIVKASATPSEVVAKVQDLVSVASEAGAGGGDGRPAGVTLPPKKDNGDGEERKTLDNI